MPIIKKWLFDRDIFIRELISTAAMRWPSAAWWGRFRTIISRASPCAWIRSTAFCRFTDNGVGMTAEEVRKYINQVAFSGANDFMEKYKDSGEQIIGHFGLGFYSAFMVADKVRIDTLSCLPDAKAVCWESDGSVESRWRKPSAKRSAPPSPCTSTTSPTSSWMAIRSNQPSRVLLLHAHAHLLRGGRVTRKHEHDHEDGCECSHDHET